MKGTIAKCLEELVKEKAGPEVWKSILAKAGMPHAMFMPSGTVADGDVVKLIGATAEQMKMTQQQAMDAFGEYWSMTYAPKMYGWYFEKVKTAKEFLLSMDKVHDLVTKSMAGAAPPHFRYEEKDAKTLVMHYNSPRGMVALMPGLIKGVAKYFKETVSVKNEGNKLTISFA